VTATATPTIELQPFAQDLWDMGKLFATSGSVVELRILEKQGQYGKPVHSGFFDEEMIQNPDGSTNLFARAAANQSMRPAVEGVYVTMNPVNGDLLARAANRIKKADKAELASDADILCRRWILFDIDPTRPSKVSSTDEEKAKALEVAKALRDCLKAKGWPDPLMADSGNGFHLFYRVDLPTDDGGLVKACLHAAALLVDQPGAKVDTTVFNPSRIVKLTGSVVKKGDAIRSRPHRVSRIVEKPLEFAAVPLDLLQALAEEAPKPKPRTSPPPQKPATKRVRGRGGRRTVSVEDRARAYLRTLPRSIEGQNGSKALYRAACVLVKDFALSFDAALPLLLEWNETHCDGPWTEKELIHKLEDAQKADGPVGRLSNADDDRSEVWRPGPTPPMNSAPHPTGASGDTPITDAEIAELQQAASELGWATGGGDDGPEGSPNSILDDDDDGRPEIMVDHEELETNNQSLVALGRDETIYARSGRLVRVCKNDTVVISDLQPATCRERLTAVARFIRTVMVDGVPETERIRVPGSVVNAILARGEYPEFRRLIGVAMCPAMAADGSLFSQTGYDPITQTFVSFSGDVSVPDTPTKADIDSAVATLSDVFADFPFESGCHRVAVLAAIFTVVLRHQIDGPVPLFLIDANTRGSGKSLIAELISMIALGMSASRMSQPEDDDECRKRITALAMCGAQLVLIDNISKPLGGASLDAVLTATTWTDRILGESRIVVFPWLAVLVATGNNVQLGADTSRRTVYIRLQSPLENPEERSDFRHTDIVSFVRDNRSALLAAVYTIARGFIQAGRPRQPGVAPWGSFEAWDRQIRHMMLWAGIDDPGETRRELTRFADQGVSALSALLSAWDQIDPDGYGIKSADIARKLSVPIPFNAITGELDDPYQEFRDALAELCPTVNGKPPTSGQIAKRLAHYKGRVVDHRCIDNRSAGKGLVSWHVSESTQVAVSSVTRQDPIRVGQVGLGWPDSTHLARERDITQQPEQKITAIGGSAKQPNPAQPTQPNAMEVASWTE
jgi:hypothetical protein